MIDARELRIGNVVWEDYGGYYQVCAIGHQTTSVKKSWSNLSCPFKNEDLSYVQLTEDILLKAGFEKHYKHEEEPFTIDLTARMYLWASRGDFSEVDLCQDGKHISFKHSHIKYLHQLQNLYFALTGTELNIQL